jgi:predicted RNase H-like nuclease (RuvC/YqgF family)
MPDTYDAPAYPEARSDDNDDHHFPFAHAAVQGFSQKLDKLQEELANLTREANNYTNLLKNKKGVDDKIRRMEEKVESLARELAQDSDRKKDAMRQKLRETTQEYIAGITSSADKMATAIKVRRRPCNW